MIHYSGTYTDQYQLSMALAYFRKERNQTAIFDYFFRKLPFGGGYAVFAGLDVLLDTLENLKFDENDLEFLRKMISHLISWITWKNSGSTARSTAVAKGTLFFRQAR